MTQDVCIYCGRAIYLVQLVARKIGFDEGLTWPDGMYRWCVDPDLPWWERSFRCEKSFPYLLGQDVFPHLTHHSPASVANPTCGDGA